MIVVRCIDPGWGAPACNQRLADCESWLRANVGARWSQWDWAASAYGYVIIGTDRSEEATLFKLKFGV